MTTHMRKGGFANARPYETKDDDGGDAGALPAELKSKLDAISRAFDEMKTKNDEAVRETKKGFEDVVRKEEIQRIEKSMDDGIEGLTREIAALKRIPSEKGETKTADQVAHQKAFVNYLRKGDIGNLSDLESKALSVGSDPDGGYFVTPDVSGRMVEKIYETSNIRQIASVQVISTDKLEGREDLGEAGYEWSGETATRNTTDTPEIGKWSIEVFELSAKPKATQKLLDDAAVNVEQWLADKIVSVFQRAEETAFVTGSGVGRPKGITAYGTSADDGSGVTWGTVGHVVSGANGAFAGSNPIDAIYSLMGTLKNAYLPNARFLTRRSVITAMRKFKDSTGQYLWSPPTAGVPESFAGFPVVRAEDMPALGTGSLSLYFGDFRAAYQIVDRTGIRTLRDPFSAKPFVEFYTTKRVGGGIVNFEALKAMKFST